MIELKTVNYDNGLPISAEGARTQIAHRIRQLRLQAGWSQAELASRSLIPLPTYRLFERTGHIQLDRLCRLSFVLGRIKDFVSFLEPPAIATVDEFERQKHHPRKYGKTLKAPA